MHTQHRVIAFEGVDGAGKSTVIDHVARALRDAGHTVHMPRVGKEHTSRPTRMIRRLTRDPRNLELSAMAELCLYCAREAQIIEESVKPALARGETVLLDRSMLTPVVLGAYGRGLDLEVATTIADRAARGFKPDLTLVFDVHPRTSRIRKRIAKVRAGEFRAGGRKGLGGTALKERVRDGYNEVSKRYGYPVFHVERATPDDMCRRVVRVIEGGEIGQTGLDEQPTWLLDAGESFSDALERMAPAAALYVTRGMVAGRALRARYRDQEPELVAWGLDREDPAFASFLCAGGYELVLHRLARRPLGFGFEDLPGGDPRRDQALWSEHGAGVARGLRRVVGPEADEIRRALADEHPGPVLESLEGLEDPDALDLRRRLWRDADVHERSISLMGCSSDASWALREKLFKKMPHLGMASCRGVTDPRADAQIQRWLEHAPKAAIRGLSGRTDTKAHGLRRQLVATGREVVDSIRGLDDTGSWALREELCEQWPSTVAWSLLGVPDAGTAAAAIVAGREADPARHSPAGKLLARCIELAGDDIHMRRRLVGLAESEGWPSWVLGAEMDGGEGSD